LFPKWFNGQFYHGNIFQSERNVGYVTEKSSKIAKVVPISVGDELPTEKKSEKGMKIYILRVSGGIFEIIKISRLDMLHHLLNKIAIFSISYCEYK